MDSVIEKAQNWSENKVCLCVQVSPAICPLDILTSHCSPDEITPPSTPPAPLGVLFSVLQFLWK